MENYNIPQITSKKKTQKEMKKQCNLWWFAKSVVAESAKLRDRWLMFRKHPLSKSHSPIAKSSYTYIQISQKTSQSRKKPQTYSFFFLTYCRYSSFFFRFRFIFVMISFQKIQAALLRSVPSTFSMKTYWAFRSTSLYHTKKWTSYPFNGVII